MEISNKIRVCVIMSIYKNDKLDYVQKAVQSILDQSFRNYDFHIIFDGPISQSISTYIYKINDDRLIITKQDNNQGLARALNCLLTQVLMKKYNYIFRMDADDFSLLDRLSCQIQFLEKNKDIDCVGTWAIEIDSNDNEYFRKQMPTTHQACYKLFQKRDCLIHPTVAFRRSYFEKAGLYPEDTYFGEDTMMWANGFANGCKFANIPEYLFKFRLDQNFFERRRGWKHAQSIFKLRRRVNRQLNYPFWVNIYALMYALAKLMPKSILNIIYKTVR